jgi:hypothetical protein
MKLSEQDVLALLDTVILVAERKYALTPMSMGEDAVRSGEIAGMKLMRGEVVKILNMAKEEA